MQLEYFCVAEAASVDQETNQVSLFNILEEIGALQFPVLYPGLVAVGVLLVEAGDEQKGWEAGLTITPPGGQSKSFAIPLEVKGGSRRHRLVQRIGGLPLLQEGELKIELTLNGKHLANHIATVRLPNAVERARYAKADEEDRPREQL